MKTLELNSQLTLYKLQRSEQIECPLITNDIRDDPKYTNKLYLLLK